MLQMSCPVGPARPWKGGFHLRARLSEAMALTKRSSLSSGREPCSLCIYGTFSEGWDCINCEFCSCFSWSDCVLVGTFGDTRKASCIYFSYTWETASGCGCGYGCGCTFGNTRESSSVYFGYAWEGTFANTRKRCFDASVGCVRHGRGADTDNGCECHES